MRTCSIYSKKITYMEAQDSLVPTQSQQSKMPQLQQSKMSQVKRRVDLVYGGGSVGLMGLISQTVYNGGCNFLGYNSIRGLHTNVNEFTKEDDCLVCGPGVLMELDTSVLLQKFIHLVGEHPRLQLSRPSVMYRGNNLYIQAPRVLEEMTQSNLHPRLFELMGNVHKDSLHISGTIMIDDKKSTTTRKISGQPFGEVKTVADMHDRKAEMAGHADVFIALPGGYETMEELLELITWSRLGIHDKPVGLLNVDGYYNCLFALFGKGVEEGFIKPAARHIILSAPTAKELIDKMEEYVPGHVLVAPRKSWEIEKLGYSAGSGHYS